MTLAMRASSSNIIAHPSTASIMYAWGIFSAYRRSITDLFTGRATYTAPMPPSPIRASSSKSPKREPARFSASANG